MPKNKLKSKEELIDQLFKPGFFDNNFRYALLETLIDIRDILNKKGK